MIKISQNEQTIRANEIGQVHITDIRSEGCSVLFSSENSETDNSIEYVTLLPDSRNIEILFSSLNYNSNLNRKIKYAYKM